MDVLSAGWSRSVSGTSYSSLISSGRHLDFLVSLVTSKSAIVELFSGKRCNYASVIAIEVLTVLKPRIIFVAKLRCIDSSCFVSVLYCNAWLQILADGHEWFDYSMVNNFDIFRIDSLRRLYKFFGKVMGFLNSIYCMLNFVYD